MIQIFDNLLKNDFDRILNWCFCVLYEKKPMLAVQRAYISFGDPYKSYQIPKIIILLIIMLIQYLVENQNILTIMNIRHV